MCGIVGVWAREGTKVKSKFVNILFEENEKRGRDGWGYVVPSSDFVFKTSKSYSETEKQDLTLEKDDLLIGICRAKPETEVETDDQHLDQTMQPIIRDNCYLVHNGAINTYYDNCYKHQRTKLDSECIIIAYKKYGFPDFVKHLPGGFAFLLYDKEINQLIIGVNHMPLYHAYIKGLGYFVSSKKEALSRILKLHYNFDKNTANVWEAWYITEVEPFTVRSIDLDSGFVSKFEFEPFYLLPNERSNVYGEQSKFENKMP